ncbi:MAG TPA: NAD(P)-dependent oxidoreductase [Alphaproteobacteria bacterium]|nr:NAD(P)-dependent oxidoreductase [Alphaproteobacteria bacterium]HRK97093.1 NAD(P)-dependent oxidoreductase [Alphaproteobacteria bacterium]
MPSLHKIALLGGSGFIGSRLTSDLLYQGHDVTIADIAPSPSYPDLRINADVREYESLLAACSECDTIINLAAAHRDNVRPISLYYDTNVTGARMTCAVAEKLGINRIVFTSSVAVYGHQHGEPDETASHMPINPYGETKSQAENVFREWFEKSPETRSLVIVRPSVVFGPTNRGNVHTLMDQIVKGRFLMVGDGENKKSMAYVGNVSAFLTHALSFGNGYHVFNYADKPDMTMNRLVNLICERTNRPSVTRIKMPKILGLGAGLAFDVVSRFTGKTLPISRIRVEKFCANTAFKADRVRQSGFTPPTAIEDALIQTIDAEFKQQSGESIVPPLKAAR